MSAKQQEKTESEKSTKPPSGTRRSHDRRQNGVTPGEEGSNRSKRAAPSSRHHNGGREAASAKAKTGDWDSAHGGRNRGKETDHYGNGPSSRQHKSRDTHARSSHVRAHPHRHTKGSNKPHPPPTQSNKTETETEIINNTVVSQEDIDCDINNSSLETANSGPPKDDCYERNDTEKLPTTTSSAQEAEDSDEVIVQSSDTEQSAETAAANETKMSSARYVYNRDELLTLKECTQSLLTPVGFDGMEPDIVKEILKRHNSTSSNELLWDNDNEVIDDVRPKHPTTLSLIREHDSKHMTKVSLSPQRRSFGSGCSWRESSVKSGSSDTLTETDKDDVFVHRGSHSTTPSAAVPTGHHTPKVIDHIPYRSRGQSKSEWQESTSKRRGAGNWREATKEIDDEPEWMSFGPSDRSEVMELKGLDEHEHEKEARKSNDSLLDDKTTDEEQATPPDPSPSSSLGETTSAKEVDSDSGLPSSSPHDDDQEFMLDGFDFSTGVSICQALDSDSDDEIDSKQSSLPHLKDRHQLTNALMNILNVPSSSNGGEDSGKVASNRAPLRAMTLDEIEEPHPQKDQDQTAFNKLLAAISSPRGGDPGCGSGQQLQHNGREASNIHSSARNLFAEDLDEPYSFQEGSHVRQLPHQQRYASRQGLEQWGGATVTPSPWGNNTYRPQFFNPSPSSLGMQPNHLRHVQLNNSWVSEMEQRRMMELNQMERQRQLHAQQQQHQRSGNSPSLGFLPTSVMRQMHSKTATHQTTLQDRPSQHNPSSQLEHGLTGLRISQQFDGQQHHSHQFHGHHHSSLFSHHLRSQQQQLPPSLPPMGGASSLRTSHMGQIDRTGGGGGGSYPPRIPVIPPSYRMAFQQ